MDSNVILMREVGEIEVNPENKIDMTPGNGYHIMLIGLTQQLKTGDKFPLMLTFQNAGKIERYRCMSPIRAASKEQRRTSTDCKSVDAYKKARSSRFFVCVY